MLKSAIFFIFSEKILFCVAYWKIKRITSINELAFSKRKMKHTAIIILILIGGIGCSNKNDCNNRFDFINCLDTIPVMDIDIKRNADSIRNDLSELYGYDLCEECGWVNFKMPFKIQNKSGFLKAMIDYDYEICDNCPIAMRERNYFSIMFNQHDKLLVEGRPIEIDSLNPQVIKYLSKVGKADIAPEDFTRVNYRIYWKPICNRETLDSILTIVYQTHLEFVEMELKTKNIDFCSLNSIQLDSLKLKYPLRIEFDLEKVRIEDFDIENLDKLEDIPVIDNIKMKEEI